MGQTLVMASQLHAYTLSDIGTYLKFKGKGRIPGLVILYDNDSSLINIYSAYLVSSCSGMERRAAEGFIKFLLDNQDLIAGYGSELGGHLFYPARGHEDMLRRAWMELSRG